ncbi:MAG: TonB-dependent receptor [Bacteroidales bacterium]
MLNTRFLLKLLILLVATGSSLLPADAFGQRGVIRGRIFDEQTNAPIPFSSIVIVDLGIGATSDLDGNYLITGVEPGFRQLRASSVGYETRITEEFMVTNALTTFVDIPMKQAVLTVESFVVTTSAFRKDAESPVSMRTITLSEIEKSPGGNRDISRVIQSLPGVSSSVSFRNDVIVRGGGASENRFYLDGMEIPNLNHFATQGASGGPAGIINTDFLREVDFYSGAFPVNRGNALSSVIDMKQVNGSQEKLNFRGSVGATDLALTANGPIGENTTYVASLRRSYLQFLFQVIGLPFLPTYTDYQVKVRTKINQKNDITFLSLGALDRFELNTGIENPSEEQQYIVGYLPVNNQWNYAIGAVYRHYGAKFTDTWVISRNMLDNQQVKYANNDESSPQNLLLDYTSQEIENKIRYEHKGKFMGYDVLVGGGAEYAKYLNSTYQKTFAQGESLTLDYDSFLDLYKWSGFAQASKGFLKDNRLLLSGGFRLDGNSYSPEMTNPLKQFSPRISASYAFAPKWSVNFNTGRFFQLPPYTTLGFRDAQGILVNKSNDLKYIRADHLVGGIEYNRTPNSKLSVEGFWKNYANYMFSVRDSVSLASKGADFGTFGDEEVTSTSDGRAYGLELLLREKSLRGFNIILSYTFVRSEFIERGDQWVPSAWDNRHLINFLVQKSYKNWDAGFRWRFVGGTPYTPFDVELSSLKDVWNTNFRGYIDYSRYNQARLSSGHQLDIRVDRQFYFDKWSLMLYLDVQNAYNFQAESPPVYLLDRDANGLPLTDPADPSKYVLKELRVQSGTVLPSIGIIIEL